MSSKQTVKRFSLDIRGYYDAYDRSNDSKYLPQVKGDSIRYLNTDPEFIRHIRAENEWAKSVPGEQLLSPFVTASLTSAYTWGFDNIDKYCAQRSKVVDFNIEERWVDIALVLDDGVAQDEFSYEQAKTVASRL